MENNNQSTPTNLSEVTMDSTAQIIDALITNFQENPTSYTEYRKHIEQLLKTHIKPLSVRSGRAAEGDDWKSQIKNRFGGRGAKWVFISLDQIESTLLSLESSNIDCSSYRKNTQELGKAWIRFASPKIADGQQCAAFEVRTEGSTIDHPKQLHYIPIDQLDNVIEQMPNTPKALKLEEDSKPMPKATKPKKEKKQSSSISELANSINDELAQEEPDLPEPPASEDPEEWEAFLRSEGLADYAEDIMDGDIDEDEDFDSAF